MIGKITISKVQGSSFEDKVLIRIQDESSRIEFFRGYMSLKDYGSLITGSRGDVEFTLTNIENVGKIKETKELSFEVPHDQRFHRHEWAEKNCQVFADKGWTAESYFGSQNSFYSGGNGKLYAVTRQYRYV